MDAADTLKTLAPIPDKIYFKIGEVANLVGVQTHVLRYWERELPGIRPAKMCAAQNTNREHEIGAGRDREHLLRSSPRYE